MREKSIILKIQSFFKRLFGGEVIERFQSPINGEILVVKELSGRVVLRVGGITQSGGMVEEIWRNALAKVQRCRGAEVQSCLVLGLGAGTVAKILNEKWPEVRTTGIEIDPTVIKIGKKYFGLDKIPNLKIVIGDAIEMVRSGGEKREVSREARSGKWDLILVDLYKGQEFPKEAENEGFLNRLKRVSAKNGLIIFNRLNFGEHRKKTDKFSEKLKNYFDQVETQNIQFNQFILGRF